MSTQTSLSGSPTTPRQTVVLDIDDAWQTLMALQQAIAETDWQIPLEEQDGQLLRLAREAAVLSHLATAVREQPDPPYHHEDPIVDPAALRERLEVILSDRQDVDPQITLSGLDLYGFVYALRDAIMHVDVPSSTEVTHEAGTAFYRLADMAQALATAATGVGSRIHRRATDMERFQTTITREDTHVAAS